MPEKKRKNTRISRTNKRQTQKALPAIPDKRYFSISEASELCGVKAYVLRYWEQEFPQLKPAKQRGNRRYYQSEEILLIRQIRKLLYEDGFTIEGARSQLSSQRNAVVANETVKPAAAVQEIIAELEAILQNLKQSDPILN